MGPSSRVSAGPARREKTRQLKRVPVNQELRAVVRTIAYARIHLRQAVTAIPKTSGDAMIPGLAEVLAALERMLLVIQASVLSFSDHLLTFLVPQTGRLIVGAIHSLKTRIAKLSSVIQEVYSRGKTLSRTHEPLHRLS